MPTLNDLYYTFVGNAYLDPEYTHQYNIGVTYRKDFKNLWMKHIELQADVYYNEVKNKIVATPTSNFFRWTMVNLGEVEIRGIDVAVQTDWQVGKEALLSGRLNYTYQKAQDFTDPDNEFMADKYPTYPGTADRQRLTSIGVRGKPVTVLSIPANDILHKPTCPSTINRRGTPATVLFRNGNASVRKS